MSGFTLHVRVIEANDIPKMDIITATDAYCILKTSSETRKTFVVKDSMHPRWNQEFHFVVSAPSVGSLNIVMRDKDVVFDDNISHLDIQFCALPVGQVIDQWYDMIPFPKVKKGGRLHLLLQMAPTGHPPFVPMQMNPMGSMVMQTPIYSQPQGFMNPGFQSGFIPQMYPQQQQQMYQQNQLYNTQQSFYAPQQFYPQQPGFPHQNCMQPQQSFMQQQPQQNYMQQPYQGYPGYPPRY